MESIQLILTTIIFIFIKFLNFSETSKTLTILNPNAQITLSNSCDLLASSNIDNSIKCMITCQNVLCQSLTYNRTSETCTILNPDPNSNRNITVTGLTIDFITPNCNVSCEPGWTLYLNSACYYVSNTSVDWFTANNTCSQQNSSLIQLQDSVKFGYFKLLIKNNSMAIWVGSYASGPKLFDWFDGTAILSTFWASGQPDNSGSAGPTVIAACLQIDSAFYTKLDDTHCSYTKKYICEKNPIPC